MTEPNQSLTVIRRNFNLCSRGPFEHEWQKAAFYHPGPSAVFGDVIDPGRYVDVRDQVSNWNGLTIGNVGFAGSGSFYSAYDMPGKVFECVEADRPARRRVAIIVLDRICFVAHVPSPVP